MDTEQRLRLATILFAIAGAAFAICTLMLLVREGAGPKGAIFALAAGCHTLAGALCYKRRRQLATARS